MAAFDEIMVARRKKEDDDAVVYEDFGKFTGQLVEERHHYIPPVKKKTESALFKRSSWFRKKGADIPAGPTENADDTTPSVVAPPPPPAHRSSWKSRDIHFNVSVKDPPVISKATQFQAELHIPRMVAIRLALLSHIGTQDEVLDVYVSAIKTFQHGVSVAKVCRTGKICQRRLHVIDDSLQLSRGRQRHLLPMITVYDMNPGCESSQEFLLVMQKHRKDPEKLKRILPVERAATLITKERTYSLIFSETSIVDQLCALVDVHKGLHGPGVWISAFNDSGLLFSHSSIRQKDF